jgi:hypothetical protein
MGKIIFETISNTYELDRDDAEVLKQFESLTGIKVIAKQVVQKLTGYSDPLATELSPPNQGKPFNSDTIPNKGDLIEYITAHLDGFNVSSALEHFFGWVPKYGESDEQERLLGMFTSRLKRARDVVEQEEQGKFELETRGAAKLYIFKKDTTDSQYISNRSEDDETETIQFQLEEQT